MTDLELMLLAIEGLIAEVKAEAAAARETGERVRLRKLAVELTREREKLGRGQS